MKKLGSLKTFVKTLFYRLFVVTVGAALLGLILVIGYHLVIALAKAIVETISGAGSDIELAIKWIVANWKQLVVCVLLIITSWFVMDHKKRNGVQ